MIDVTNEKLIPLSSVPKLPWMPRRRGDTTLNVSTVWRWATAGLVRGARTIKLETLSVGEVRCTSEAALLRFFERLDQPNATQSSQTPTQKNRAVKRATSACEALGV
jgi:hypothetical protein